MNKSTAGVSFHLPAPDGIVPGREFTAPTGSVIPSSDIYANPQHVTVMTGADGIGMVTTHSSLPIGTFAEDRKKHWIYSASMGEVDTRELEPGEFVTTKYLGLFSVELTAGEWTASDPQSGTLTFTPVNRAEIEAFLNLTPPTWATGAEILDSESMRFAGPNLSGYDYVGANIEQWVTRDGNEIEWGTINITAWESGDPKGPPHNIEIDLDGDDFEGIANPASRARRIAAALLDAADAYDEAAE